VSVLQQPMLPHVFCTAACSSLERVSSKAVCAAPRRVCVSVLQLSTLSLEVSGCSCLFYLDVFVQQQPVLCQDVYGLQQLLLHLYCLFTRACAAPGVCLQELLRCNWCVCLQKLCVAPRYDCLNARALCCTWTCLSTRACAAPMRVCLQYEHGLQFFSACFETGLLISFFSTCSRSRNKPKDNEILFFSIQTENILFVSRTSYSKKVLRYVVP
jgi:hypothetical protein